MCYILSACRWAGTVRARVHCHGLNGIESVEKLSGVLHFTFQYEYYRKFSDLGKPLCRGFTSVAHLS